MHDKDALLAHNHVVFVLGMMDTTVPLNTIGLTLIYYAVYGYF